MPKPTPTTPPESPTPRSSPAAVAHWLRRSATCTGDTPTAALWHCLDDGLDLLEQLSTDAESQQTLLSALLRLNLDVLMPASERHHEALSSHLATAIATLEQRYQTLDSDATADHAASEDTLHQLELRLWFLHLLSVKLDGEQPTPYQDLLLHLEGMRARLVGPNTSTSLVQRRQLDHTLLIALSRQAQSCLSQADTLLQQPTAGDGSDDDEGDTPRARIAEVVNAQQLCRRLATLLLDGLTRCNQYANDQDQPAPPDHNKASSHDNQDSQACADARKQAGETLTALRDKQNALLEQILILAGDLPEAQAQQWLRQRTPVIIDFAADTLSDIPDRKLSIQTAVLKDGYQQLHRFRTTLLAPRKKALPEQHQQLRRIERRMHSEWVEAGVSAELARRFGPHFEDRLDLAVLILVFAAIGILVVDLSMDLTAAGLRNLILLDTGICVALLSDFLLRLHCAPDRANFFRRHWLTDLLPSIPFAGLGYWLSTLAIEAQGITALRLLRVFAVALRKARPLIQVVRVFLFAARGMDRLARRYRHLLNWDILFFEPQPLDTVQSLRVRGERLGRRVRARNNALREDLSQPQQATAIARDLTLAGQLSDALSRLDIAAPPPPAPSTARQVAVETVIDRLTHTDPWEIAELLGVNFPRRLAKLEWVARLPPLRWLPGFNDVIKARRETDNDLDFAEALARRFGSRLQSLNDRVLFLSDMHGVITAPQFVDRIGYTLVNSMRRPRNRLLMFGAGFVVVSLLVKVLPFHFLKAAAAWLSKTLGLPLLILGFIAFVAVWFGNRLRTLAQTNTEFYTRIAEAKSINLLGDIKRSHAAEDQALLARRVLRPEARIHGRHPDTEASDNWQDDKVTAHFRDMVLEVFGHDRHGTAGSLAERVYLLYRDYLRGAHFDRGNTHTTDHLLGSPALLNLRYKVLRLEKQQHEELEALDLRRTGGLTGPSMWLRFVSHAMTQRTGQLVEEYNRHAIPISERNSRFHEAADLDHFNAWLLHKQGHGDPDSEVEIHIGIDEGLRYATTTFNALDFLSNDPNRDSAIQERFGAEILALVRSDRQRLVREVFGIPAIHRRDPLQRSFNPLKVYNRYLGRGRVFLLPLALLAVLGKGIAMGFRWFLATLRQLRHPEPAPVADQTQSFSDPRIALRKIHRMRKPVFLASTELRCRIDIEYLGLYLPGEQQGSLEGSSVFEDLDMIGSSPEEYADYLELAEQRRQQMSQLQAFLQQHQLIGDPLRQRLAKLFPDVHEHRYLEVLRAISAAYAANYRNLEDLISGTPLLSQRIQQAIEARGRQRSPGGLKRSLLRLAQRQKTRTDEQAFDAWWQSQGRQLLPPGSSDRRSEKKARGWVHRWWQADYQGTARLIKALGGLQQPADELALEILDRVMRNVHSWTEQLVTLRTVQALTILDIHSTTHIIRGLARYDDDLEEVPEVRVRML